MVSLVRARLHRPATVLLSAILISSSSLPYLFVGPLPLWIACGLTTACLVVFTRQLLPSMLALREIRWGIGSWLCLVAVTMMMDVLGSAVRDVMPGPVLNLLTLLTFVGALSAASLASRAAVVNILFLIAMLQGAVSALQFLGIEWFWNFGATVFSSLAFLSTTNAIDIYETSPDVFDQVGRARGTHLLVHLFNGVQSALVVFCLFMTVHSTGERSRSRMQRLGRHIALGIAVLGLLLSFSRSGVVALTMALFVALSIRARTMRLVRFVGFVIALLVALLAIGLADAPQFPRLFGFDVDSASIEYRLEGMGYAFKNFLDSPLIGASGLLNVEGPYLLIHSVPMRYLSDYGLVGFVLYFAVLVPFLVVFVRGLRSHSAEMFAWAGSGLVVLVAIVADSWTHSSGFLRRDVFHAVILAVIVGSMLGIRNAQRVQEARQQSSWPKAD